MATRPLTSKDVAAFLPLNAWTKVILLSIEPNKDGKYMVTTEDKMKKRLEDMEKIALMSDVFQQVQDFVPYETVAVQIDGDWYRGSLFSYNEYLPNDTRIELIDVGSVYDTKLKNLFKLPLMLYEPLSLPIKFKNFTPNTTELTIKPLLSESFLHEGAVMVEVKSDIDLDKIQDKKQQLKVKEDLHNDLSTPEIQYITNGNSDINILRSFLSKSLFNGSYIQSEIQRNDLFLKTGDYCIITFFEDFTCLYVCKALKIDENDYDVLNIDLVLKTANSTDKILLSNPVVGCTVKVFSSESGSLFRAKILRKNKDGSYVVYFIDFGHTETVQSNVIYELADELKKPGLAVKVGMNDLNYIQCTNDIKQVFENFADKGTPFIIEFDEESDNFIENIKLKDAVNGYYINSSFIMKCPPNKPELDVIQISENDHNNDVLRINSKSEKQGLLVATKSCLINDFQNIQLNNEDYCFVSYFKDFKNIYVCKAIKDCSDNSYKLHNLSIIMKTLQSEDRKTINNPAIGDIVKVLSPSFKDFYRAEIKNINNTDFHVTYIDYGNTEVVQSSDLFELSNDLKKENKLPIKVSMEVPLYSKVNKEIEMLFTNLIENNVVLSIEFKKKNKNGLENVILKEVESGNLVNDNVLKLFPIQKPKIKNADSCYLRYFENFDSIYVSKVEDSQILVDTIQSTDRKTKTNPAIGDIIKVLSPLFEGFYRAEIIKILKNIKYLVFYIDFGNTEVVQSNNLFELSDNLYKKPGTAIKIGINMPHNVEPNDEIKKMFSDLADNEELIIIEFDESSETGLTNCILKIKSSNILVNNKVTELLSDRSSILDKTSDCEMKNEENLKSDVKSNQIKPKLKNGEVVFYRYFHNSDSVFVGQGSEEHHQQFLTVTEKTMKDISKLNKLHIALGDIVKAEFDGIMYRAKILEKVNEDHYCISFIDFGNQESVHINDIFELPDDLKQIPDLCTEIGIKGLPIIDEIKKKIITGSLEELELVPLYIEYDEKIPSGLKEATLRYKANNLSVFDDIFKKNNIFSIKDSLEKLPITTERTEKEVVLINSFGPETMSSKELQNGDVVFCCNFEDFNHIYLCKSSKNLKPENEKLIIDSSEIEDMIVKQSPIKYGDIIRVKFNGKVFRAQVIDKTSNESYTVILVDMGKSINVSADNMFELPEELKTLKIPGLAQQVGLKKSIDIKITKTVRDYFDCLWYKSPVPLILTYDESGLNLKKLSDGHDIVEDLIKLCKLLDNEPDEVKPTINQFKMNGSNVHFKCIKSGDYVEFLFGNNIDSIYVRHSKLYDNFKDIIEELKDKKIENLVPINPKPNDYVTVYSRKYNGCYRAKVIGPTDDGTVKFKCTLIDFGYLDNIPPKYIFELPNDYTKSKIPTNMIYRITLSGLTKINNNYLLSSYLKSFGRKQFILEFDKNADLWYKQVVLKDIKSNKSLNQEIKDYMTTIPPPVSQQKRLTRKTGLPAKVENESNKSSHPIESDLPEKVENKLNKLSHTIKSGTSVYITHFENFNSIFIRDASHQFTENFNEFYRKMLKYYRKANTKELVSIGDKVCVKSILNMVMYSRAIVTHKIKEDYKVFYMDFGNTELVHIDNIFELPNELEKPPCFAIEVQLKNMPPIKYENQIQVIREYFKRTFILSKTKILVEFNGLNPKGCNVILKTEIYKTDISDKLKDLLKATPVGAKITGPLQNGQQNLDPGSSFKYPYILRRQNSMLQ